MPGGWDQSAVALRLELSSGKGSAGNRVDFEVTEEIRVKGVVVIPKGSAAYGAIVEAQARRRLGRAGKLLEAGKFEVGRRRRRVGVRPVRRQGPCRLQRRRRRCHRIRRTLRERTRVQKFKSSEERVYLTFRFGDLRCRRRRGVFAGPVRVQLVHLRKPLDGCETHEWVEMRADECGAFKGARFCFVADRCEFGGWSGARDTSNRERGAFPMGNFV